MNFWQKLAKPFTVLAPMEGVTDVVFRELVATTAKPDVIFTEFTNVEGINSKKNKMTDKMLKFTENQRLIVAQIWGLKPEYFEVAAEKIASLGFDGIDLNLGCPVRDVVKKGACSGMIGNFLAVNKIITAIKKGAPKIPVSIKTRLGRENSEMPSWAEFLLGLDIAALTIHGRTAKLMSEGEANWEEISKVVEIRNRMKIKTVIIGNGDVKNLDQAQEKYEKYGVDGVMIGRGIMENPWVFDTKNTPHSSAERLDLLKKHLQLFEEMDPDGHFDHLKKYFSIYVRDFPGARELRKKMMRAKGCDDAYYLFNSSILPITAINPKE